MNDTKSRVEGFECWALEEREGGDEMQNPFSVLSNSPFILIWKNTGDMCARLGTVRLATGMHVLRLTGEHEIPEIRELVDDNDRHLET